MPYPRWLAKLNKRLFNPAQIKRGAYPVVTHVGRSSGKTYQTPLDAFPTKEGYVLVIRYGQNSDWVRNVLAAETAVLRVEGEDHELIEPRLVSKAKALGELASEPSPDFNKADDFLLMNRPA